MKNILFSEPNVELTAAAAGADAEHTAGAQNGLL
jgi:hypothetical protein